MTSGELRADSVTVRFGGLLAVAGVTLTVPEGGFVGLIGPNGAGKTTLFNAINGFQPPSSGRITYRDLDVTRMAAWRRARLGIGRTFQKLELFGRMTVFDNLMAAAESGASRLGVAADLLHLPKRHREERRCAEMAEAVLNRLELGWVRDRRAGELPVGTARIVELGRAIAAGAQLLLLDEPSSGLDSDETKAFGHLLTELNESFGMGILLVEHDMDLVLDVCKEVYVLDFGRLIAHGAPSSLAGDPGVRAAYLGEEEDGARAAPAPRG